jgi:uncharacterized protein with HEPN domain
MPPKDWHVRITDIIGAIEKIDRYIGDVDFDSFCEDDKTADAVIRNIGVIGGAIRIVPADIMERYPDVAWSELWGMRNVVIHQYSSVDLEIVWGTIRIDLPLLKAQMQHILDTAE